MTPDGLERVDKNDWNNGEEYRFNEENKQKPVVTDSTDTIQPVIEKKENEVYRYSLNEVDEEPVIKKVSSFKLRIPTNPLNAMLRL